MNYQEYKKEFLTELRNESAISGSDTEDEFVGRTLDILSEFDEIEEPVRIGMGDKKRPWWASDACRWLRI